MDKETAAPAPVIDVPALASPIVVKIETPKDLKSEKQQQKASSDANDVKKSSSYSRLLCQLLPVLLFLVTFASVLSLLIVYMDPSTEYRHQQFRQNLAHDYDMKNVAQDNKELIWFVKEVHMKKYPMPNLPRLPMDQFNFTNSDEMPATMSKFIGKELLNDKRSGFFLQSLTGSNGPMMTAPWLHESLEWGGCIVEPDPHKYFSYRKMYAKRNSTQIIHASLSPQPYPKEVALRYEDGSEVKVETTNNEPERIKCFPLFTILLALNRTHIDLLSLGCQGQELEILQTLPWDVVSVDVISIHLFHLPSKIDGELYTSELIKYLEDLSYALVWSHDRNFIFQRAHPPQSG